MKISSQHYSSYFDVPHDEFVRLGVYDGFVNEDSTLHINPLLLKKCNVPEFERAYESFLDHFKPILLLATRINDNPKCFKEIERRFQFKEIANTGLGYSNGSSGTGISGKLARQLAVSSIEVINEGMRDPNFFAILSFIEENIGADRISDMTISILYERFLVYTQRVATELNIKTKTFRDAEGNKYQLPVNGKNRKNILFIPDCLLCDLPLARSFDDISTVCDYNDQLRRKVAEAIGLSWADFQQLHKSELKEYIIRNRELLTMIVDSFKSLDVIPYDFIKDNLGEYLDREGIKADVIANPIEFLEDFDKDNVMQVTLAICEQFKKLIECNHMYHLLYNDDGTPKSETATQLVFYLVAYNYCIANDIDLSRECDPGCGELDFKLSSGCHDKVLIEVKLSTNSRLAHGLTRQLPAYQQAENTPKGILLIIKLNNSDEKRIERVQKMRQSMYTKYGNAPDIIVVDATEKPSASKI